ncbi:MAG: SH3 domain-containing protein [Pararhodobacter sp.]|nr:SH3 domain-containing protein [Pararhodobacter sp.]TVR43743.1 MAG: SH3 domain-containing protein [Paracoccaceae bacterium]
MTILRFPIAASLIACVALLAASLTTVKASEVTYRVVNVAADDVLNVRDRVGVPGSRIVGILPPGTGGIVWTGPQGRSGDGGLWYHISHPRIPGTGGWVNARFLREEVASAPVIAPPVSAEPPGSIFKDHTAHQHMYRVVGVAANDVLNIRSGAGVSHGIVGMFPPDARNVQITGRIRTLNSGAVWVEVRSAMLPGGVGWVNGRFLDRF